MYQRHFKALLLVSSLVNLAKTQNVAQSLRTAPALKNESVTISAELEAYLCRSSIIYGLISVANESLTSADCYAQLRQLQGAIRQKEAWAMKALDAAGNKQGSFVLAQNYWLGSRKICEALNEPIAIRLMPELKRNARLEIITEMAPYAMHYNVLYLRHTSPWQLDVKVSHLQYIHVGLCVPSACKAHDIEALAVAYVEHGLFVEQEIYDMQAGVVQVKDLKLKQHFYAKFTFKLLSAIVCFTIIMMVCAACLRKPTLSEEDAASERANGSDAIFSVLAKKLSAFICCYDVSANCEQIFTLKDMPPGESAVMDGLRSFSTLAIVLLHGFLYSFDINNTIPLYLYIERFVVLSTCVDIFITLSGFLRVYYFFCSMQKTNDKKTEATSKRYSSLKFLQTFIKRYLRFAPLYLAIICMADLWNSYSGDVSVYYIDPTLNHNCVQYWWRNLLFIQTCYPIMDMCVNWTWSLSAEMQYFLLATILLLIYRRHPKLVKSLTIFILLLSIIWNLYAGLTLQMQVSMESLWHTGYYLYFNPLARIWPYIMGAIAGWYLSEKRATISSARIQSHLFYVFYLACFLLMLQMTDDGERSSFSTLMLLLLTRCCFSLFAICVIFAGALQSETWYCRMFGAKIFQHFNRLCFACYLLNPLVIIICVSLTSEPINADFLQLLITSFGYLFLVYFASVVCSLAFELPYVNLSKRLF